MTSYRCLTRFSSLPLCCFSLFFCVVFYYVKALDPMGVCNRTTRDPLRFCFCVKSLFSAPSGCDNRRRGRETQSERDRGRDRKQHNGAHWGKHTGGAHGQRYRSTTSINYRYIYILSGFCHTTVLLSCALTIEQIEEPDGRCRKLSSSRPPHRRHLGSVRSPRRFFYLPFSSFSPAPPLPRLPRASRRDRRVPLADGQR